MARPAPTHALLSTLPRASPAPSSRSRSPASRADVAPRVSPSTEAYDRGEKLRHYRAIATLREVVLVDHRQKLVEVHRREEDGSSTRHEAGPGGTVSLGSIGCELPVDEVYRDGFVDSPG